MEGIENITLDETFIPNAPINLGLDDIIGQQMQHYSSLLLMLSSVILLYVLWNNFVRSPSKKKGFKEFMQDEKSGFFAFGCDEGIEPSIRVKKISRALDEYLIVPALVMFYISLSYYLSIRG